MKSATIVLLGILLLGACASLNAQPAGTSETVLAYTNERFVAPLTPPAPLPGFDGLCLIYYTMIGDFDTSTLFAGPLFGPPVVDRAHARFIWVSDYTAQPLSGNEEFTTFMIAAGTAAIYYTERPDLRDWKDRATWGDPIATFVRKAGVFLSRDGGVSGTFVSTAQLVSSKPFKLYGKTYNLKDVIGQGITCFETAVGDYEAGTCVATGK
ncbi:MAG TPA: hypothetical protein VMS37_33925 [Verrucomicrobiae bacterium]|nr:hypothetical protein [Verrucomicrobiae bacterium]